MNPLLCGVVIHQKWLKQQQSHHRHCFIRICKVAAPLICPITQRGWEVHIISLHIIPCYRQNYKLFTYTLVTFAIKRQPHSPSAPNKMITKLISLLSKSNRIITSIHIQFHCQPQLSQFTFYTAIENKWWVCFYSNFLHHSNTMTMLMNSYSGRLSTKSSYVLQTSQFTFLLYSTWSMIMYKQNLKWLKQLQKMEKTSRRSFIFIARHFQTQCLQCFDAVGWASGRASGL